MNNEADKRYEFGEGELYLWLEQGTSVHIKAISKHGDPVELNGGEALELAAVLFELGKKAEE